LRTGFGKETYAEEGGAERSWGFFKTAKAPDYSVVGGKNSIKKIGKKQEIPKKNKVL